MNYTYILQCNDGTYYTGWTNHLEARVKAHNEGKGAKYTRCRTPVALVYFEEFGTKEEAMRREAAIKRMKRKDKIRLMELGETGCSQGDQDNREENTGEKNGQL